MAQTVPYRMSVAFNLNSKPIESGIHYARPNLRFPLLDLKKNQTYFAKTRNFPRDRKKLLSGNQLPKPWFLPISIGLLFVVTYPYCSLKLLSVHPASTNYHAFKKSHLEGNISTPRLAAVASKTPHFCAIEIKKPHSVIAPFNRQTSALVILWHFITVKHRTGNVIKKLRTKSFVKGSSRIRNEQHFRVKGKFYSCSYLGCFHRTERASRLPQLRHLPRVVPSCSSPKTTSASWKLRGPTSVEVLQTT